MAGLSFAAVLVLALREMPTWRMGGTVMREPSILPPFQRCPAVKHPDFLIVVDGDSNTAGNRNGPAGLAFPALLEDMLGGSVEVVNRGVGAATIAEVNALPSMAGEAALAILMIGTNDAAVRGWIFGRTAMPLPAFRSGVDEWVKARKKEGTEVLLLAPPPTGSVAMQHRLDPYRLAISDVARMNEVAFRDSSEAFKEAEAEGSEPFLMQDALHLNQRGHRHMARWLARCLARRDG